MADRLVNVDRRTAMLLPVDLREWVPEDDIVHFVIESVDSMNLSSASVNKRGSGSEQYPPHMMVALLIYCYSSNLFSSRRIEAATYRDIAVRYLTGDTHPDHDTICTFRRENAALFKEAFLEVLRLASEMKLVKVGTISVDGTHIKANASKHKSVRYDRLKALEQRLRADIEELLAEAEEADSSGEADGQRLPREISRREDLRAKLAEARRRLEQRAEQENEEKRCDGDEGPKCEGKTKARPAKVADKKQINLVDPDSNLMRKSSRDSYQQAYNAQAAVDAEGGQLIVATDVLQTPSDANELVRLIDKVQENVGEVKRVLADGGYVNTGEFEQIAERGIEAYVAISEEEQNVRQYEYRPPKQRKPKVLTNPTLIAMREKLRTEEGRRVYARRAQTVEPTFGIIKEAMGFRQFLLRGIEKARIEWDLVCIAYNMRRIYSLISQLRG
jgi:transposase